MEENANSQSITKAVELFVKNLTSQGRSSNTIIAYKGDLTQLIKYLFGEQISSVLEVETSHIEKFKKQNIQPMPGMQVNIDDMMATVKTVSGGRTLIDFNHPLSGRDVVYDIKVNKLITDDKEKIRSYFNLSLGLKDIDVDVKEGNATIKIKQDYPKEIMEKLAEKAREVIPSIKKIDFTIQKEEKKQ